MLIWNMITLNKKNVEKLIWTNVKKNAGNIYILDIVVFDLCNDITISKL